jgi:hypothetical protein
MPTMSARLGALVLIALIAAPAVSAAPVPTQLSRSTGSPFAARPRAVDLGLAKGKVRPSGTISPRGRVNLRTAHRGKIPKASQGALAKVHLGLGKSPTPGKPRIAGGPRAASVAAVQVAKPDIYGTTPLQGLAYGTAATTLEPPDLFIAVGPDNVVQVTNVAMRTQGRQGEGSVDVALSDFFSLPDLSSVPPVDVTFNSDPRVLFDSLHQRWFVSELSWDCMQRYDPTDPTETPALYGHGFLDFAVSDTADPNGLWTFYSIGSNDVLLDFPGVGTSTDKVAISANIYYFNSHDSNTVCGFDPAFQGSVLFGLPWSQLAVPGGPVDFQALDGTTTPGMDNQFAVRPAIQIPASSPTLFAVAAQASNGHVSVIRVTGDPRQGVVSLTASIEDATAGPDAVPMFVDPPQPQQPGPNSPIAEAVDGRPTDAVWQNNRLVFVATTPCTTAPDVAPTTRDCVRVGELNTSSATATQTQDFLLGEAGRDLYMGGIGLSQSGSLHVTYTRSSTAPGDYPSGYHVYQNPGDPANTVSNARPVLTGLSDYNPGSRWGDYQGIAADPQRPGAVWRTNESVDANHRWTTDIQLLDTDPGSTYTAITPTRVLDSRNNIGLSGRFTSSVARTFQVTNGTSIPTNAVAVTGNVTVVQQTSAGYVSVTPRPTNSPSTSTLNFPRGDIRANNLTLPLGPGGTLSAVYKSGAGSTTHLILDVTGYFLAGSGGAEYNVLTPARILDTRTGNGLSGKFHFGVPRAIQVLGRGLIPNSPAVVAITANITVTGQTSGGYIAVTPTNQSNPSTSNINFPVADNRANGATIPLDPLQSGKVWAVLRGGRSTATTDLVLDVTGYYETGVTGLKFHPLNPGRVLDTRPGVALSGLNGPFSASPTGSSAGVRALTVAGHQGVPPTPVGQAVTGNLTVTHPTAAGYVSIRKVTGDAETSTINFPARDTRANGATVPLNPSGALTLHYAGSSGTADVILDITGYFGP